MPRTTLDHVAAAARRPPRAGAGPLSTVWGTPVAMNASLVSTRFGTVVTRGYRERTCDAQRRARARQKLGRAHG